jgi:hypothetical protein
MKKLFLYLFPLLMLTACGEKGSDEPNVATLYDICEVASTEGATILHLYRPDSDTPIILTASAGALGTNAPANGTAILAAYLPAGGTPYVSDNISLLNWANITNSSLKITDNADDLDGWDKDEIYLLSAWRAGGKLCMRLQLGYSDEPRKFALIVDRATATDPVPTAYLYHARNDSGTPTFNRQYYVAFDISNLWESDKYDGLRVNINNSADPSLSTLTFLKTQN